MKTTKNSTFKESDHPRAADGKFGSGGGGSSKKGGGDGGLIRIEKPAFGPKEDRFLSPDEREAKKRKEDSAKDKTEWRMACHKIYKEKYGPNYKEVLKKQDEDWNKKLAEKKAGKKENYISSEEKVARGKSRYGS